MGGRNVQRRVSRVLVAEDNPGLRRGIARALAARGVKTIEAANAREAIALLQPVPDALILDVHLAEGSAFEVLEAAHDLWPAPLKIATSGVASRAETFRLSLYGVRAFLEKPFAIADLEAALDDVSEHGPPLTPSLQDSIGHISVRKVQELTREVMLRQALALSEGSRSEAARLLQVTRQAVQQMIRPERRSKRERNIRQKLHDLARTDHV